MSKNKGFSLIEMLIYMSIMVLMLAVIMNIVISIIRSGRIIGALRSIEDSAVTSAEHLTRELRQTESINTGLSVLDSNPGRLVLEGKDSLGVPRTVEFYLSGGQLFYKENGVDIGALSQSDAQVSNLIFRRFAGSNSEGAKIELTIESGVGEYHRLRHYYFSALLR